MELGSTDFELLGLTQGFAQDVAQLEARWKALQRQHHPDNFAAHGAADRRVALQWSVRINEAYARLKDPLKRAAYLCELQGQPIKAEHNTAMPPAFLMQQMQWREALEDARSEADLVALNQEVYAARLQLLADCEHQIDDLQDFAQAATSVRSLMFIERFAQAVEGRFEQMDTR